MPIFHLNKLVRTKLPDIYDRLGEVAGVKELSGAELDQALLAKLREEVSELETSGHMELKELADVLQVVRDVAIAHGSSFEELELLRQQRESDRGPFVVVAEDGAVKGTYISTLRCSEDDEWTAYYRKEPERFPEEADDASS